MKSSQPKTAYEKEFERFAKKIQKRIRDLRLEHELSQEDLMQYELSLRTVQRIEKQGSPANITLLTIYKLCKAYGLKPHELLEV